MAYFAANEQTERVIGYERLHRGKIGGGDWQECSQLPEPGCRISVLKMLPTFHQSARFTNVVKT
jgi:hypothetical protein